MCIVVVCLPKDGLFFLKTMHLLEFLVNEPLLRTKSTKENHY